MLTVLDRKNIERAIARLDAGERISRQAGNHRNATLLAEQRRGLEKRLTHDDEERLRFARRRVVVATDILDRACETGTKETVDRCERALNKALDHAAEFARRVEPATPSTRRADITGAARSPTAVGPGPNASGAHSRQQDGGGSFIDLRTGERVVCQTITELRARVFAMLGELHPPALAGFTPALGSFPVFAM